MRRNLMALLGVAALLAALAGSAVAQEKEMVWKTDGKRYWRVEQAVVPFEMPKTTLMRVAPGENKEGDFLGLVYQGKQMIRVYFREVPLAAEPAKGHECSWRLVYEKKAVTQHHFCLVNGAEKPCPGMEGGACLGMK